MIERCLYRDGGSFWMRRQIEVAWCGFVPIIVRRGHFLPFLCGSVQMSTRPWNFCQWTRVSLTGVQLCSSISNKLCSIVHSVTYLSEPILPSLVLELQHHYILLVSVMLILRTKYSLITPGAIMKTTCDSQHLSGVIIFCLIQSMVTYQPKFMTFLLHINKESIDCQHPIMASTHTCASTHFDALMCHSNGHVPFPSASVMRR